MNSYKFIDKDPYLNITTWSDYIDDNDEDVCGSYYPIIKRHNIMRTKIKIRSCVIVLHPRECEIEPVVATIQLLHHEIMHDVLKRVIGESASNKWDEIAECLCGCPCP